ncbi:helix-turn-helix domain-containing protein [Frankia sp. Cas3]|uniref:helix-turn-helix domain-containing protein n=1 Tax=Frankia sp. Cas3 TaxID=3073926 RepID=UPI002AD2D4EA|nr:GAF domain-containing protein [Frankia sp. Cas3]
MSNPWLALEPGSDPAERTAALRRAHEAFVTAGAAPPVWPVLRPVVADSWRRSAEAGVDPDRNLPPVVLTDGDLDAYRRIHPLADVLPLLRELLGGVTDDCRHLMAISDAAGQLLWVEGHFGVRRLAERVNFVEGAAWDERNAGSNAPGTALVVDHAVQLFAAEHFSRMSQSWTCSAAPIHDPASGESLGVIDITGGDQLATPYSLALVQAAARAAEGELARIRERRRERLGDQGEMVPWLRPGVRSSAGRLQLEVLGRDEGLLRIGDRRMQLSPRRSEILVILLAHPEGLTGEQLGVELYGDDANPITLHAEMCRLRRLVGPQLLHSRPYRVGPGMEADFMTVAELLESGALQVALRHYQGPLLPRSEAPGVRRARSLLEQQARAALLASGDPDALTAWTRAPWGQDDLEMWRALTDSLPVSSPRRILAAARLTRLSAEFAAPQTSAARSLQGTRT